MVTERGGNGCTERNRRGSNAAYGTKYGFGRRTDSENALGLEAADTEEKLYKRRGAQGQVVVYDTGT
jgi:hypothetical protein